MKSLKDIILFWSTLEGLKQDPTESSSSSVHTPSHHGVLPTPSGEPSPPLWNKYTWSFHINHY